MDITKFDNLRDLIIEVGDEKVLLDADVAVIYGVETKRINEAVKNNPDRFPAGYVIQLNEEDKNELVENFDRFNRLKHSSSIPRAFTEKGLYMLATILKSRQALQATLAIVETFAKIKELSRTMKGLSEVKSKTEQKSLMQRSGELITEILDDDFETSGTETSIELNFAVLKLKHTIKKKNK